MTKRRQHYVPKFYLKAFQSAPKRIHVCHLDTLRSIRDASLRDQCYLHRFYGSVELEDSLSQLENAAAPVLRTICESGRPPSLGSEEHAVLLAFVGLQAFRTPAKREAIKDGWGKMDELIFGDREPDPNSNLSRFSPVDEAEALKLQFGTVSLFTESIADLRLYVGRTSPKELLITSDNPLFKYNSYCRGIRYWGCLGAKCQGLQIFLPLSPRILLLLYDASIYKITDEEGGKIASGKISKRDVARFNSLQVFNAQRCIYFSDWSQAGAIERLVSEYRPGERDVMRVNEGKLVGSDASSIVHLWEEQPELPFSMPLSQLRFQASKVPLKSRVNVYRGFLTA